MNKIAAFQNEPIDVVANTIQEDGAGASFRDVAQPKTKISIALTINTCFVALLLVALVSILWLQWSTGKRNIEELLANRADIVINHLDSRLADFLDPASVYVTRMAADAARNDWNIGKQDLVDRLLKTTIVAAPQITSASILFPDGSVKRAVTNSGAGYSYVETYDHENGRFLKLLNTLKRSEGPVWTAPVYRTEEEAVVTEVWHPIRQNGRFVGAWGASVAIAHLSEIVARFGDQYQGTAFILHGRKKVLAHPFLMSAHPDQNVNSGVVSLDRLGDYYLQDIWSGSDNDLLDAEVPIGGMHEVRYTSYDADHIAFYRWIERYDHVPWIIGIMFPAKPIDVQHNRLIATTYIGLGTVVLALFFAMWIGRAIAKPIRRTARNVSKIGSLDFEDVTPLPSSMFKEIDELATSYNAMLRGLRSFQTYIPRNLVRRLVNHGSTVVSLQEKRVAVMFTDIVGFTSICDGNPASDVASFLNHHFEIIGGCIEKHGGTIDKYIGDAVMAFWGAPEETKDAATHACDAAYAIADAIERDNQERRARGLPPIKVRIGIHVGPAIVGNIGAPGRVNYTVIGDTVNICQRIEGLPRDFSSRNDTTVLISDAVARELPASRDSMEVGEFEVKGMEKHVKVYRLVF